MSTDPGQYDAGNAYESSTDSEPAMTSTHYIPLLHSAPVDHPERELASPALSAFQEGETPPAESAAPEPTQGESQPAADQAPSIPIHQANAPASESRLPYAPLYQTIGQITVGQEAAALGAVPATSPAQLPVVPSGAQTTDANTAAVAETPTLEALHPYSVSQTAEPATHDPYPLTQSGSGASHPSESGGTIDDKYAETLQALTTWANERSRPGEQPPTSGADSPGQPGFLGAVGPNVPSVPEPAVASSPSSTPTEDRLMGTWDAALTKQESSDTPDQLKADQSQEFDELTNIDRMDNQAQMDIISNITSY